MDMKQEVLRTLSSTDNLLEHCLYGLLTEAGEALDSLKRFQFYGSDLDTTHMAEEIGDILWYAIAACIEMDIDIPEMYKTNKVEHGLKDYRFHICSIANIAAEYLLLDDAETVSEIYVGDIFEHIDMACLAIGITRTIAFEANNAKLKERYPEKWEKAFAETRDTDEERKAMEEVLEGERS